MPWVSLSGRCDHPKKIPFQTSGDLRNDELAPSQRASELIGQANSQVGKIPQKHVSGVSRGVAVDREVVARMDGHGDRLRQRILPAEPELDMVRAIVTIGDVALIDPEHDGPCLKLSAPLRA